VSGAVADNAATTGIGVAAAAKLNLYLHVLGRRADGYHVLDSLVAFADVCDVIRVRPEETLRLTVGGPFGSALPKGRGNLVLRAAQRLAAAGGVAARAHIHLTKALPVSAGIGGGSADAAAALQALSRLWDLRIETADLRSLAFSLGADVPVCLEGRAALISGAGESVRPVPPLPDAPIVLVNPGRRAATAKVFARRTGPFSQPAEIDEPAADVASLARLLASRHNDLTESATALVPDIARVLSQIAASSGCLLARMSGSGATCFGLYAQPGEAEAAARSLATVDRRWWVRPARLLSDTSGVLPPP